MEPSRRGILLGLAAAAVPAKGGLTKGLLARRVARPELRQPGSLPYPDLPAGTDTIPQVEHIVVLMMENHSYDNRLGMLWRSGADGFTLGRDRLPTATNPYAERTTWATASQKPSSGVAPRPPRRSDRPAKPSRATSGPDFTKRSQSITERALSSRNESQGYQSVRRASPCSIFVRRGS
jgi:phospholipase C